MSSRAKDDEALKPDIIRVFKENFESTVSAKVWRQLKRKGRDVARCGVERLKQSMGLHGAIRGEHLRTNFGDKAASCPLHHVNRKFHVSAPNRLWVSDFTYVSTRSGFVCFAFVIDGYARYVVGWRASWIAHAGFVLGALEQAIHDRRPMNNLIRYNDRGCQDLSIKYTERLAELALNFPADCLRQIRQRTRRN